MTYSNNVIHRVEQILGYGLSNTAGARTYTVIGSIIYADVYTGNPTIQGYSGKIRKSFNYNANGVSFFNELMLEDDSMDGKQVEVTATWGSPDLLSELDELLAWLKDTDPTNKMDDAGISTKQIEDFHVVTRNGSLTSEGYKKALIDGFGFYIRKPLIVNISSEQRNDWRYF